MNFFQRPKSLAEAAHHMLAGAAPGMEIKDFLHEFQHKGDISMVQDQPPALNGKIERGEMLDAYLQALAVYLSGKMKVDPPAWTQPAIQLKDPCFAPPGSAIRNYLLMSSPAPFRARNLFLDEDSLTVV